MSVIRLPGAPRLSGPWQIRPLISALVLVLIFATTSRSASPAIGTIMPRGGQRGKDITLIFGGGRLSDTKEVVFYSPGFTVKKLQVVNDGQVKATVHIADDCRLGEHAMRLRTASGLSDLQTFFVGALPEIDEKEPNSDFKTPQKIPLNVTVNGVIDNEDVDYFSFEAKKGQRITAEIEGMRLAGTFFDPYVAILDSKRFELTASDDAPLVGQDCIASAVIPADGTYVIEVRDSSYGGNGACRYRLHVGTFPRPTAIVPAGGKMGDEVEVRFLGDPAGPFTQKFKLPTRPDARFGLFAQNEDGVAPSPNPFRLSEYGNVIEVEPNDTHATATPATLPVALNGVIDKPGDVDCFRFKMKKGETYDVRVYARQIGSPLDSVITISAFNGGVVAANDDSGGPDSYLRFGAPADGEYVLGITDHLHKGGPTYFYRVEFTPVRPQVTVSIPKVAQFSQERQTIVVPRGNRYATLISAARADFGGPLQIGATGLPRGITVLSEDMAPNLDVVPVVFEAAPDAPIAGTLGDLTARLNDPKQKTDVPSHFLQSVDLIVSGPGQSVYWKYDTDRAAFAVAEAVPFKIHIVEPKVPLVQNGSMNLKVVVERQPGFKAQITVQMLFNPPGVGSATAATIPQGQNETVIPMNAAGNAQVRKWKIVVVGQATVGNGPVWVASQLANLEVAAPYVNFAMERAAAEQGKNTEIFCKLQQNTPFPGSAKVQLLGLPNKVTAPVMEITKDTKELAFKITVDKTSPAGQHRNLFCQVVITQNGEQIIENTGGTELRIDVPLPKVVAAAPKPAARPKAEPAKAAPKRLSRLEQLRLEQQEREKALQAAKPGPR